MTETSFRSARLHKILGNPLRYRILLELFAGPRTPGQLASRVNRALDAVSRSLTILQLADLVSYRTVGRAPVYYPKHEELYAYLLGGEEFVRRFELPADPDRELPANDVNAAMPVLRGRRTP